MANEKLSELLSEVTAPAETDRVYLADNIATTPGSNFLEVGNLLGTFRTSVEVAAGAVPTDIREQPATVIRYGDNDTPGTTDLRAAFITSISAYDTTIVPIEDVAIGVGITLAASKEITGYGMGSEIHLLETLGNGGVAIRAGADNRFTSLNFNIPAQSANTDQFRAIRITTDDTAVINSKFVGHREASYPILYDQNVNRTLLLGCQFEVLSNGPLWKPNITAPTSETFQGSGFVAVANMIQGADSQGRVGVAIDGNCIGSALVGNHVFNIQGEGASAGTGYALANDGANLDKLSGITLVGNVGQNTQDEVFHQEDECNGVLYVGNVAIDGTDGFFCINDNTPRNVSYAFNFARDLSERGMYVAGTGSSSNINLIGNIAENFGTGGASDGMLIGQGASSHINALANIVDGGTGDAFSFLASTKMNVAYNIARACSDDGLVLNAPTESVYIESNNILSDATGGPVDESKINGCSGDKDIYRYEIDPDASALHILGHFRRPAVITRIEQIYDDAADGSVAPLIDIGFSGGAEIISAQALRIAATGQYTVVNTTSFVSRLVPAGSVLTMDLTTGTGTTYKFTLKINYFEYS